MPTPPKEHDWPLVVWPRHDGARSRFKHWLTLTHMQRGHQYRHTVGAGPGHQGRVKSCPVELSEYVLTVCRYVERNPVRAGLVERAVALEQRRDVRICSVAGVADGAPR